MKKLLMVFIMLALICSSLYYLDLFDPSKVASLMKTNHWSDTAPPDYQASKTVQNKTNYPGQTPEDKGPHSDPQAPQPQPQAPEPSLLPQPETPAPVPAQEAEPIPEPAPEEELSNNFSAMEEEMLEYINTARAQHNLAPLTLDSTLSYGAYLKSKDMAETGYFNHNSPLYGSPFDMMKSLGISFRTAAENISKTTSVKGAHEGFMNSAGHRQNILGENFKKVGLGFYQDGRYLYVTQWFTD